MAPLRLCLRQLRPAVLAAEAMSPSAASISARCPSSRDSAEIERLGQHLMAEVGRVVPALPVSLVASAILAGGRAGAVEPGAQRLGVRADAPAAGPRAPTCTFPATTRNTPSTSACAC